jgi:hypothetical protein
MRAAELWNAWTWGDWNYPERRGEKMPTFTDGLYDDEDTPDEDWASGRRHAPSRRRAQQAWAYEEDELWSYEEDA